MKRYCLPAALLGLAGLAGGPALATDTPAQPAPPTVLVTRAVLPPVAAELPIPGTIEAWQETQVRARTSGYVRRWHAEIGAKVAAGDLLVELDTPEADQALAAARASVEQAKANLELARVNHERWKTLVARKTVPAFELDERYATFKARSADLLAAEATRQRYEELAGFKRLRAPYAGTITQREVENGQLVEAGNGAAPALYRLAETARLKIRVGVPQANVRSIHVGLPVEVRVPEFAGQRFAGKVARTSAAIEPASRTLLTEIELDNAEGTLMPGLYAQVFFKLPFVEGTVMVPTNTVRFDGKGARVATVDATATLHWVPVSLGRNLGTQFEVLKGLAVETRVVLNPADTLVDGLAVDAKEPPAPKSP